MRTLATLIILALSAPAASADTALILANSRYEDAQDLRQSQQMLRLEAPLSAAGFDVIVVADGTAEALRAGVEALLLAQEEDRVVILSAGHVVRSRGESWLLGTDTSEPNLATVQGQGVTLSGLLEIASRAPGRAVVMVGMEPRRIDLGDGLARGMGAVEVPQGVTLLSGAPRDLAGLAEAALLRPGADLAAAVAEAGGVRSHGFLSSSVPFLDPEAAQAPISGGGSTVTPQEQALWDAAVELDTVGAYRAYLQQYPQGRFEPEARARISAFERDPAALAEAEEAALGLTRDDRRRIQRDLSLMGYDTRGIDGIFGPGTRTALQDWQSANGAEATGFVTARQRAALREQAALRAAELEEQARIERESQERADRAFWQATGQGRTGDGLRSYLARYPDGLFADIARDRLAEIEAVRRTEAEAQERADWDEVRRADTVGAYEQYLERYPNGLFRDDAGARIEQLRNPGLSEDARANAEAREAALNLPSFTRLLVEQRLAGMGLEPGRIDGAFDGQTRRAIRRYQSARGLNVTGYLDQATVVRLLAEAIGGRVIE